MRSPSRKPRMTRFSSASASSGGTPSPRAVRTIPLSSPANSSARSLRLRATAKASKPLPRLALLAGTSTVAMGRGIGPSIGGGQVPPGRRIGRRKTASGPRSSGRGGSSRLIAGCGAALGSAAASVGGLGVGRGAVFMGPVSSPPAAATRGNRPDARYVIRPARRPPDDGSSSPRGR